jgi:hypothetical protein
MDLQEFWQVLVDCTGQVQGLLKQSLITGCPLDLGHWLINCLPISFKKNSVTTKVI